MVTILRRDFVSDASGDIATFVEIHAICGLTGATHKSLFPLWYSYHTNTARCGYFPWLTRHLPCRQRGEGGAGALERKLSYSKTVASARRLLSHLASKCLIHLSDDVRRALLDVQNIQTRRPGAQLRAGVIPQHDLNSTELGMLLLTHEISV